MFGVSQCLQRKRIRRWCVSFMVQGVKKVKNAAGNEVRRRPPRRAAVRLEGSLKPGGGHGTANAARWTALIARKEEKRGQRLVTQSKAQSTPIGGWGHQTGAVGSHRPAWKQPVSPSSLLSIVPCVSCRRLVADIIGRPPRCADERELVSYVPSALARHAEPLAQVVARNREVRVAVRFRFAGVAAHDAEGVALVLGRK